MFVKVLLVIVAFLLLVTLSVLASIKENLIRFMRLENPIETLFDDMERGE